VSCLTHRGFLGVGLLWVTACLPLNFLAAFLCFSGVCRDVVACAHHVTPLRRVHAAFVASVRAIDGLPAAHSCHKCNWCCHGGGV
jgi:hypothetical protein